MKKSFVLLIGIAVSLLLATVSCKKDAVSTPNPYIKQTTAGYTDTPYTRTLNLVDTPYTKTYPVKASFVDTPYTKKK
ncbi:MAG: hypothetical protein JNM14_05820 [Ferruginibacter sp.]|nr:hypothetical protein [Ferruginibacter sp.]